MNKKITLSNTKRFLCLAVLFCLLGSMFISCDFIENIINFNDTPIESEGETESMTNTEELSHQTESSADETTTKHPTVTTETTATVPEEPTPKVTKIACVGDSLTYGYGLTHADSYPSVLQNLLGAEKYLVKNFGAQGRTMTLGLTDKTFADRSYYDTEIYQESLAFQADIVILCLGTNDSWKVDMTTESGKQGYVQGLTTLVNSYRQAGVKEIYVCLPPHCLNNNIGDMIEANIIPLIQENVSVLNYKIIDYFTPTKGHSEYLLADQLHFKPIGYSVMANAACQHLLQDYS